MDIIQGMKTIIRARLKGGEVQTLYASLSREDLYETFEIRSGDDNQTAFWKAVYKDYIACRKKWVSSLRFLPGSLLSKWLKEPSLLESYDKISHGERRDWESVDLKGILLPQHKHHSDGVPLTYFILDTFTQFLLDLDIDEDFPILEVLPEGPYERQDVRVDKGDIVIDAGAALGDFTLLASYKGADVHAFEPSQYIISEYLQTSVNLNKGLSGTITIAPYALADTIGKAEFAIDDANIGASRFTKEDKNGQRKARGATEEVEVTTLDEYVHRNSLGRVDFIKADIEGAERLMLKGAKNVLKDFAPKLAICTYHLPDDPEVLEALVRESNPNYIVEHKYKKMYAYVPVSGE
jgi:FkbM family methyltransferase